MGVIVAVAVLVLSSSFAALGAEAVATPPAWRSPLALVGYALMAAALLGYLAWQRARRAVQRRRAQERLRESEDRLSMALWGSGDELFDWRAPSGTLVRMSGARGENAIVVPNIYHVDDLAPYIHRDDFPAYRDAFLRCLAGETESYEASYRIALQPGKFSWRLVRGRVVERDADGNVARVAGAQRDISALKAVEAQLLQLTETLESRVRERTEELDDRRHELELANAKLQESISELRLAQAELIESEKMASLGRLVAGIAHEVNTPLGVGVTAVSFLKQQLAALRGTLEPAGATANLHFSVQLVEQAGQLIESNLTRAAQLVSTFKQVAVDQSASTIRQVNVRTYLEGILESLHPQLRRHPHRVEIQCDPAIVMTGRPDALYSVVSNLIVNSTLHGYPDGRAGVLGIAVRDEGERLRLVYSDDGAGMSPDVAERIYEPFFTTRRGDGGTGLGMHIVYNLVTQALAGRIALVTAPGQGVRFDVVFPRVHPDVAERGRREAATP